MFFRFKSLSASALAVAALALPLAALGCSSGPTPQPDLTATEVLLQNGHFASGAPEGSSSIRTSPDPNAPSTIARGIFRAMLADSTTPDAARLATVRKDWMRRGLEAYEAGDLVSAERSWRVAMLLGLEAQPRRESLANGRELLILPVLRSGNSEDGAAWLRLMVNDGVSPDSSAEAPRLGRPDQVAKAPEHLSTNAFAARALKLVGGLSDEALVLGEATSILVVATHEEVTKAEALLAFSTSRTELVTVETQVALLDGKAAREFITSVTGVDPYDVARSRGMLADLPRVSAVFNHNHQIREVSAVKLNSDQLASLAALTTGPNGRVITAPRLTTYGGQLGNISMVNQVSYVRDYEIQHLGDTMVADPVIDVVSDGIVLATRAHPVQGGNYLAGITVSSASLSRPIRTFSMPLVPGTSPVTIQIPHVNFNETSTTGTFEGGQTYLLARPVGVPMTGKEDRPRTSQQVLVVTFKFSRAETPATPGTE